ncbi:hypothetical protein AB0F88_17150 [Streptosporangium sp. NPDC023963]|uniref:hypothetical protein n=1 Tax=Streptosporangium sp. NPDC023963 TaxID=3155608 RepID=UPI0034367373
MSTSDSQHTAGERTMTSTIATRRALLRELIAEYDGDATKALLDLADIGEIAINYLNREWFASYLAEYHSVQLTDAGWTEIAAQLDGYDEHVCDYEFPNVQNEFAAKVVAGLLKVDDENNENQEEDTSHP